MNKRMTKYNEQVNVVLAKPVNKRKSIYVLAFHKNKGLNCKTGLRPVYLIFTYDDDKVHRKQY